MESANLHYKHQQHQEHLVDQSSPPFATPFYDVEAPRAAWTPNSILNNGDYNPNISVTNSMTQDMGFGSFSAGLSAHDQLQLARIKDALSSASSSSDHHSSYTKFTEMNNGDYNPNISVTNSMTQDMGFGSFSAGLSAHDQLQLARIKDALSSASSSSDHHSSYTKFTEMLTSSSSSSIEDSHLLQTSSGSCYLKNEQRNLLRNFSSGCQINSFQLIPSTGGSEGLYSNPQHKYCPTSSGVARGTFSQIFPTINISNLSNQTASSNSSALSSSSLDMNLEALDLFNSVRFSTGLSQASHDHLGVFKSCSLPYNLDDMQLQLSPRLSNSPNNVSSGFNNGVGEVKRSSSSFLETKSPQAAAPKKSRLDSRSTCPPFKVRKEKLGDRIAALQQLVAPFGKTDTASVLMEAIGYIKFLTNQVETLSVPYMKSSRNRTRKIQGGLGDNEEEEEGTRDLKTRGLCLVPVSCLSYVTDGGGGGGGGGVWPPPPPHYGAAP